MSLMCLYGLGLGSVLLPWHAFIVGLQGFPSEGVGRGLHLLSGSLTKEGQMNVALRDILTQFHERNAPKPRLSSCICDPWYQ